MLRSPVYKYFKNRPRVKSLPPLRILMKNIQLSLFLGESSSDHIFVVGPPRNGTTLIQKIIANHPNAAGPDTETFFFLKRRLDMLRVPEISNSEIEASFLRSRTKAEFFDQVASRLAPQGVKFIEKSPEHCLALGTITKMFPLSKVIFIYRDGRDAYVSALRHGGVRAKIGNNYPELWRDSMRELLRMKEKKQVFPIRYEDLCAEPDATLKRAFEHCGLSFDPNLIRPDAYSKTRYANTKEHARLREPISGNTIGIHRKPENFEDRDYFESIAKDMLTTFGYA